MVKRIVPIFLPNRGCPHRCLFCNEKITAGDHPDRISRRHIAEAVECYLGKSLHTQRDLIRNSHPERTEPSAFDRNTIIDSCGVSGDGRSNAEVEAERQIAFYGGNFTGIEYAYQRELLNSAQELIESGVIDSIRISTRPDYIDEKTVGLLQKYTVRTVEIGGQSMVDSVLARCGRGHTAADTVRAIELLKSRGFNTGIHLMAGLPGDDRHGFDYTIDRVIALKPDTVRIHPTIVFANTGLADLYHAGDYIPLDLETAVDYCCHALTRFRQAGIDVIRMGLQTTAQMEEPGAIVAGPFHPAFRSLVEGLIFLKKAESMLELLDGKRSDSFEFRVSDRDLSDFRGINNRNMNHLKERFGENISVRPDPSLIRGEIALESGDRRIVNKRN